MGESLQTITVAFPQGNYTSNTLNYHTFDALLVINLTSLLRVLQKNGLEP